MLFLFVTASRAAWTATVSPPIILGHYDLGIVPPGRVSHCELLFTNAGATPFQVSSIRSLCDCVQVVSYPKTLQPQAGGIVSVLAQPQQVGRFEAAVQVEVAGDEVLRLFMLSAWVEDGTMARWTNLLVKAKNLIGAVGEQGQVTFIDVRSPEKYRAGRIPGSLNLPLYTVKARAFLRLKRIVLVGEGHDDRTLLAEAEHLESKGFASVQVMEGGFVRWRQEGGGLEGDNTQGSDLATITAMQFHAVHTEPSWLVVNIGALGAPTGWPAGSSVKTIAFNDKGFALDLAAVIRDNPVPRRILLASGQGENYDAVQPLILASKGVTVFFLAGGVKAYQEYIIREVAMQNRRLVTLTSQASAKASPSGRLVGRAGGCCGGSK